MTAAPTIVVPTTLPLVLLPDARLHQVSRPVEDSEFGADLDAHMNRMVDTMFAEVGVGLAGVQVGDMRRILVCILGGEVVRMVNPVISRRSTLTHVGKEGCLSVPGRQVERARARQVTVEFRTPFGETVTRVVSGKDARVVQHEVDHLDGKTILG